MTSKKQSGFREIRFTLAMILGALMVCGLPIAAGASNFNIGSGIYDITGPAAELGMMGYSMPDQKTEGISMRLRARAFVVVDPVNGKRVAFVSADTGIIPQGVKQQVTKLLLSRFGGLYTDQNVLISANHTHSGPGAYSHYALYNLSMLGYDSVNFNCVANGIFQAIVRAHNNLTPGTILINTGQLDNCGWNRSPTAYNNNPAAERAQYAADTDKTMVLLKFVTSAGREIGALNWFAVHPTSLGNTNRLISGDNKGYASYLFEKAMGTNYAATNTFVAAFAQTNSGDVSPNIYWGYPNGTDDYSHMLTIGERQYQKAITLYDGATTALSGGVDFRYQYVDFSNEIITSAFMPSGMGGGNTCTAAIGVSMLAGSTEDGKGLDIPEGITYPYDISILGTVFPWSFTILPEDQACHAEKPIVLPMGRIRPQGIPLTPEVLPVQILKIGNLAIVGHPTEITTMAGRRLRETVQTALSGMVDHVVIAALSNAYAGYVATREEYAHRDIGDRVAFERVGQRRAKRLHDLCLGFSVKIGGVIERLPIALLNHGPVGSHPHPCRRGYLLDSFKQGLGSRAGQKGEVIVQGLFIDAPVLFRVRQQGFDLGGESQAAVVDAEVEGLDAQPVADQPEDLL